MGRWGGAGGEENRKGGYIHDYLRSEGVARYSSIVDALGGGGLHALSLRSEVVARYKGGGYVPGPHEHSHHHHYGFRIRGSEASAAR